MLLSSPPKGSLKSQPTRHDPGGSSGSSLFNNVEVTRDGSIRPAGFRHCRVSLPPAMHCVKGALSAALGGGGANMRRSSRTHARYHCITRPTQNSYGRRDLAHFLSHVSVLSLHHQLHPTLLRPKALEVFFTTSEPHNSSGRGHVFSRIFDVSPGSGPFGELIFHVGGRVQTYLLGVAGRKRTYGRNFAGSDVAQ